MKSPRLSKPRPRADGAPSQLFPVPDNARPGDFEVRGQGFTWYVIFRGERITRDYRYFHKAQEACDAGRTGGAELGQLLDVHARDGRGPGRAGRRSRRLGEER